MRSHVARLSWGLLSAVAVLGALSAVYVVITPTGEQTSLVGRSWAQFAAQDAEVASIVSRLLVVLGLLGMAFGVGAMLVVLIPYRRGEKWSWYTSWLMPLTYGAIAIRQLSDQYAIGYFYTALAMAAMLALLLPIRDFRPLGEWSRARRMKS
jgi:hypothetical protein